MIVTTIAYVIYFVALILMIFAILLQEGKGGGLAGLGGARAEATFGASNPLRRFTVVMALIFFFLAVFLNHAVTDRNTLRDEDAGGEVQQEGAIEDDVEGATETGEPAAEGAVEGAAETGEPAAEGAVEDAAETAEPFAESASDAVPEASPERPSPAEGEEAAAVEPTEEPGEEPEEE